MPDTFYASDGAQSSAAAVIAALLLELFWQPYWGDCSSRAWENAAFTLSHISRSNAVSC